MMARSGPSAATATGRLSVCERCGTDGQLRDGHPWCRSCGHYLVYDPEHEDWTSYANRDYRRTTAESTRRIASSAAHVQQATAALRDRVPDGWRIMPAQHLAGAFHTLDVHPALGPVDAMAYLTPPQGEHGWLTRIHNRTSRIDFPLYTAGGARAASFPTAGAALHAAIRALRVEFVSFTGR